MTQMHIRSNYKLLQDIKYLSFSKFISPLKPSVLMSDLDLFSLKFMFFICCLSMFLFTKMFECQFCTETLYHYDANMNSANSCG